MSELHYATCADIPLVDVKALLHGYADALLAIVGQPWRKMPPLRRSWCPGCLGRIEDGEHRDGCPWLMAARVLGIA